MLLSPVQLGDDLVLTTTQAVPANTTGDWKEMTTTLKIRIKKDGKRLANPILN